MELSTAISDFLDHCAIEEGYTPSTVHTYRQVLNAFSKFVASRLGQELQLESIDRALIRSFQRHIAVERALDDDTYVKYCSVLRSFVAYLRQNGLASITRDDIRLPKNYLDLSKVKALSVDDLIALLQAPDGTTPWGRRDRAIMAVLYSTGMRVGEICALDRCNVPEELLGTQQVIELPIVGKGRKPRVVFLDRVAQQLLAEYLQTRTDQYPPLFIAYRGQLAQDARLTPRMVQAAMARYAKMAGLSQRPTPHTLRHTFAVHKLMAGADIRIVQTFLGHASLSTTQRYTRVTDSYLKEAYLNSHTTLDLGSPRDSGKQPT